MNKGVFIRNVILECAGSPINILRDALMGTALNLLFAHIPNVRDKNAVKNYRNWLNAGCSRMTIKYARKDRSLFTGIYTLQSNKH